MQRMGRREARLGSGTNNWCILSSAARVRRAKKGAFLGAGMATNKQFLVEITATVPQSESLKLERNMLGFD